MSNRVIIVQGAQWGSEAKGAIAALICERENVNIAVRTGATNAGHTVYYNQYRPGDVLPVGCPNPAPAVAVKMQQLPTGWVNPDTMLVLGAGALIDPAILARECEEVSRLTGKDVRQRLLIDYRAGLHDSSCAERSAASGRHHAIGATGKGCSEALMDRIRGRGNGYKPFGHDIPSGYQFMDTATYLNNMFDAGAKILLEGTQGTLLDLYIGPYPYVTHKQTLPAQWMLECGLSPALPTDIVQVVRTYPIRVAGNSGPMPLEISWPMLARRINVKRAFFKLPPIVPESYIDEFEEAVIDTSMKFATPYNRTVTGQHTWDEEERVIYQKALSELNAAAMASLPTSTVHELSRLFEFTTVTKKLRRVAELDIPTLKHASLLNRPHRVAITFMNYVFPHWWYEAPVMFKGAIADSALDGYVRDISLACGAPVTLLGFGPESHHHVAYR